MGGEIKIAEYFEAVETEVAYNGYFYSAGEALAIVILGSLCGLRNVNQIHQWAASKRVSVFLKEHFGITSIPCYYWLLCLLELIKPQSLNTCFIKWAQSMAPEKGGLTLSFDGKTIRSTGKMDKYKKPLHIISAQLAEHGITLGQRTVDGKSNEIPAVRELINLLNVKGCIIVADAMHCQKETAKAIIDGKADYVLSVKDNQPVLKQDIEEYVQDERLRETMDVSETSEKNGGRIERRTAYTTCDVKWLNDRADWAGLACIGAIHSLFSGKNGDSDLWHYYISSKELSARELLKHARLEWSVETMHWLLDVHFGEDFCRIADRNDQQTLNMVRKIALNCVKRYKDKTMSKRPLSKIMFDCLLDHNDLLQILRLDEN
jgi:predicted transposase YbfD/YdcC